MPAPLAAERLLEFANSSTRDHREAVANSLPLSITNNQIHFAIFLLALILLTGCKPVGPNYNRPAYEAPPAYKETGASTVIPPPAPAGGAWQPANPSDSLLRGKWWEIYQDPQLNQLEERIEANNQTLRQALETYLAVRDQITVARAALYPTLSAGPSISRNDVSANGPSASPGKSTTYNDFSLSGQASWEPDFWGRIRRTVEAARSSAQASAADHSNIVIWFFWDIVLFFVFICGL
jgi:outer membrane protein TolC